MFANTLVELMRQAVALLPNMVWLLRLIEFFAVIYSVVCLYTCCFAGLEARQHYKAWRLSHCIFS